MTGQSILNFFILKDVSYRSMDNGKILYIILLKAENNFFYLTVVSELFYSTYCKIL